ncbi:MAG: non-canonical purine NTP pyrophosphatase [Kofleriaceae bacterium]
MAAVLLLSTAMATRWFLDAQPWRADEVRQVVPGLAFELANLPAGYATSAPEPGQRARDKVLASELPGEAFAEAADLVKLDGTSLRLELDSDNSTRFCRWWRETEVRLILCVAYRREVGDEPRVFTAECAGVIADRPAGEASRGWDRIFYPAGHKRTLAELSARAPEFGHNQAFVQLAAVL